MTLPKHLIPVAARVRATSIADPPSPWRLAGSFAVGGLTEVGFGAGSDWLLVVSSRGRGLFDCLTGERVARDEADGDWHDMHEMEAYGIGPLAGQRIRTAGLHGGGLSTVTPDGWQAEDFVLDWPVHTLLLVPPDSSAYGDAFNKPANYTKVAIATELRAFGFSPTGRSLIVATSSDLMIWSRG